MLKYFSILFFLSTSGGLPHVAYSQKANVNPYIGAYINFLGTASPGIDGGLKFKTFYAGVEYSYAPETENFSAPFGSVLYPSFENYFGIHGGFIINPILFLGLVCLYSRDHHFNGSISPHFDAGPDMRLDTRIGLIFGVAYTVRRGVNAGINFLF
ncbi:MAG TPA: hypothetical protein VG537_06305 [Candidatus Kapabacteria bacterium]|jgi:hypothetical protein|nr:hypothetical protein [Candidatus Kapabacteria bacterium]